MPEVFIGGRWTSAVRGGGREIRCPADGTVVARVDECGPEDAAAEDVLNALGLTAGTGEEVILVDNACKTGPRFLRGLSFCGPSRRGK